MSDGNRVRSKSVIRRLPARPNRGDGSKNHKMADANKGIGKVGTMGVDKDGALGLEHSQGAQRRHFPQSDMQCGDRDKLRKDETTWISMRQRRKDPDHEAKVGLRVSGIRLFRSPRRFPYHRGDGSR